MALERVQRPAKIHNHEHLHKLIHVDLLPGNHKDTAGSVDGTGLDYAKVEIENQNDENAEGYRKAQHGEPAVYFHTAEEVQQEDEDKAHGNGLELVQHDVHAARTQLPCKERGGAEDGHHGHQHEEQGNQEDYLVSGKAVHEVE